jgi:hypothetical protein
VQPDNIHIFTNPSQRVGHPDFYLNTFDDKGAGWSAPSLVARAHHCVVISLGVGGLERASRCAALFPDAKRGDTW